MILVHQTQSKIELLGVDICIQICLVWSFWDQSSPSDFKLHLFLKSKDKIQWGSFYIWSYLSTAATNRLEATEKLKKNKMEKVLKIFKIIISLCLMIGIPQVIISTEVLEMGHSILFTPLSYLNAFIGTGLIFSFGGFRTRPSHIGNIDSTTIPKINQNWAVLFITLIINLTVANLCGTA